MLQERHEDTFLNVIESLALAKLIGSAFNL